MPLSNPLNTPLLPYYLLIRFKKQQPIGFVIEKCYPLLFHSVIDEISYVIKYISKISNHSEKYSSNIINISCLIIDRMILGDSFWYNDCQYVLEQPKPISNLELKGKQCIIKIKT